MSSVQSEALYHVVPTGAGRAFPLGTFLLKNPLSAKTGSINASFNLWRSGPRNQLANGTEKPILSR